ncbi:MAG: hypothetical protein QXL20_01520 [Candidatus Bathyarchaeia archaeon]
MMLLYSILGFGLIQENLRNIRLGMAIVMFDRDYGTLFFQDFMGYGSLIDDAEWLLERTPQRSWGFMIRPIFEGERYGLWIGEYGPGSNQIFREEILFDAGSSAISRLLSKYAEHRVDEGKLRRRLTLKTLRRRLSNSEIVRNFKHYICPLERFYRDCPHIEKIYRAIRERYSAGSRIRYSLISDIIFGIKQCDDVIICPLLSSPNALDTIINLNKALRSRRLGEMKIIDGSTVEIT